MATRKIVLDFRVGSGDLPTLMRYKGKVLVVAPDEEECVKNGVPSGTKYTGLLDQDRHDELRWALLEPRPGDPEVVMN